MKKIFIFIAVFSITGWFPVYGNQSEQKRQWQPISEISAFECAIIENASKKPCARVIESADYFVLERNLVIVRFQNGDDGYYIGRNGSGAISETTANSELDQEDERKKIFDKFTDIWNSKKTPNELTPDELNQADGLMLKYFSVLSRLQNGNSEIASIMESVAARGNRYASEYENLLSSQNDNSLMANFYDYYIGTAENSDPRMRDQDRPSDEDKRAALKKLINAIKNLKPDVIFTLSQYTGNFFKKNEPAILQSLINANLIKSVDSYLN